MTSYWKMQTS